MSKKKVVPMLGREAKVRCPPMSFTRRREMARPMPVPPCVRDELASACMNGRKIRRWAEKVMPSPVSWKAWGEGGGREGIERERGGGCP